MGRCYSVGLTAAGRARRCEAPMHPASAPLADIARPRSVHVPPAHQRGHSEGAVRGRRGDIGPRGGSHLRLSLRERRAGHRADRPSRVSFRHYVASRQRYLRHLPDDRGQHLRDRRRHPGRRSYGAFVRHLPVAVRQRQDRGVPQAGRRALGGHPVGCLRLLRPGDDRAVYSRQYAGPRPVASGRCRAAGHHDPAHHHHRCAERARCCAQEVLRGCAGAGCRSRALGVYLCSSRQGGQ